ncbi:MAG: NAAT family transporter [Burkholderiales bacterium]|nr:NAAT family transporter [Burkholderiales bacterium]
MLQALVLVPVALLPIINPLGTAPVFVATVGVDRDLAKRLARQIAINSWYVLVGCMLVGTYVLTVFGISLAVVRLGGGLLLAATAWRMLHSNADDDVHAAAAEQASTLSHYELVRRSFFPMTFPLTTGPGTIAASIALGAQIPTTAPVLYLAGALVAAVGAMLVSVVLYYVFWHSAAVLKRLGDIGTLVMMRLMAFILLCIGIQMMWTGWAELQKDLLRRTEIPAATVCEAGEGTGMECRLAS